MDIAFSSTTELAAAIKRGAVSASEALDAQLAQIDKHNPALNAVIMLDVDGARKRAAQADGAHKRGESWGALHGVPFTLKDTHETKGLRTTVGFPPFAKYVPAQDSVVVARLKAAGAILVGKTNTAMLLGDFQTGNPLFGRTNNPWKVERTPGGSSGGAAAALAAGMTPFEIGTDMQSSIRLPAHFCGVFGLKPTENRVSLEGGFPNPGDAPRTIHIMSCIGPMARSAEDLALLYRIIAGPDARDTDVQPVPVEAVPQLDIKRLRIACAPTFPGFPVAADIRQAVQTLARKLSDAGAIVEEADLPELDFHADLAAGGELIGMMLGAAQPDKDAPPPGLSGYFAALHKRDRSIVAWEKFLSQWDALLCPVSMTSAFPHCEAGTPLKVDGRDEDYWMVAGHGALFNYSGHPAIAMPCGLDGAGLPIGVQLVGKRWSESRLLAIAQALSPLTGGFRRPPGY
jgi:amidase